MIRFDLKCSADHRFDSWFQSAAAFDKLHAAGMVTCAICGSAEVQKAIMAPRVRPARNAAQPAADHTIPQKAQAASDRPQNTDPHMTENAEGPRPLSGPPSAAEQAFKALRAHVEANSEYVGTDFAKEARAIHDGAAPDRPIYGEADLGEAKKLVDDGIEVAALPFRPNRKTN